MLFSVLVTTVDQTLRFSRLPWIGNSFLSNSCWDKKSTVRKTFNTKTHKAGQHSVGYGIFSSKNTIDVDETDDGLSSMDLSQQSNYTDDYEKVLGKQAAKKKVVLLTDHSLKRMRETSNIYLQKNSAYHKQRLKKIETNIGNKHRAQIDRQLTEVESIEKERYRKNIQNMKELSNVRTKYLKEKKKRVRTTYVSVAALEMPEVDRYAYGLPADGKEYTILKSRPNKTKLNIAEKWKESMHKARSIVKVLALRDKVERTMTLPILKPLTSHAKRKKDVNKSEHLEGRQSQDSNNNELQNSQHDNEAQIEDFPDTGLTAAKALLEITSDRKFILHLAMSIIGNYQSYSNYQVNEGKSLS